MDLAFAAQNLRPELAMETSRVEVLKRLAELGFGVAIVPRFSVQRERESGSAERSVGALTPRAFAPTRAARASLALAQDHSKPRRSSSSSLSE